MPISDQSSSKRAKLELYLEQFRVETEAPQPEKETGNMPQPLDETKEAIGADDIAIIGMAGRFPGSPDLASFWQNLKEGKNLIQEIPQDRWPEVQMDGASEPKLPIKHIGAISDVFSFDAALFGISPREAEAMDPHQRVLLEVVWETLEHAGYAPAQLSDTKTGVFIAMYNTDFAEYSRAIQWDKQSQVYLATGVGQAIVSNRISYLFNWHGPSEIVSTACSSALVGLHKAVQAIRTGDCQMALVGGVSLLLSPARLSTLGRLGILSAEGYCAPFDKDSPGEVLGEGVGTVLLKPLSQARQDGDTIYALLKATGTNHHGNSSGSLTMPSVQAQRDLMIETYRSASIDPQTIGFIEAHGSGNVNGDMVELLAFQEAFTALAQEQQVALDRGFCGIGSSKGNTGFLEAAGGMAQLLKTVLSLQHQTLPATLNFKALPELVALENSPFYLVAQTIPWPALTGAKGQVLPRRGALNAYGLGGTNAHIVVEEYVEQSSQFRVQGSELTHQVGPEGNSELETQNSEPYLVVLSAQTEDQLQEVAENLHRYVTGQTDFIPAHLKALAYTLQVGRKAMRSRLALVVDDAEMLCKKLATFIAGKDKIKRCYTGQVKLETSGSKASPEKVKGWLIDRKLKKVARQWIKGVDIDWSLIYRDEKPRRIGLPTYPFARKRYWLPEGGNGREKWPGSGTASLHPLVQRNTSVLAEHRYSSTFTGEEFFLRDHQVYGEKVFPGVAYLEMARAAGEMASQQAVTQLSDIVWTQPLKVKGPSQEVQISLYPASNGAGKNKITFEISAPSEAGRRSVHSRGNIIVGTVKEFDRPARLNIAAIQAHCPTVMPGADCYRYFYEQGISYGRGFQGIEFINANTNEALARLCLPGTAKDQREELLPPLGGWEGNCKLQLGLMDAALQATLGLGLKRAAPGPYLPFAVQQVEIYGTLPEQAYAYARYSAGTAPQAGVVKYDVALADEQGEIVVFFSEFTVRAFAEPQGPTTADAEQRNGQRQPKAEDQTNPVAKYYDAYGNEITLAETEELYLNYLPFPQTLKGFSWVKFLSKRYDGSRIIRLVRDKHRELRQVLFRTVDFSAVKRVLDIGCGYGSDLVRLAREHSHLQVDGYTISAKQVEICRKKIALAALPERVQVHHRDSAKDPFPGQYDLIYGIEVMVHIKDKGSLFVNIEQHLKHGGYLVIADFTSNIRTEIDLDEIGTYTITKEQWLELFSEHHLQLGDCVDVSQEMSNSLYDPDFHQHQNVHEEIYQTPVVKGYHDMDNNLHLSLKKGLVSYVLMVLRKDETIPKETLLTLNRQKLMAPTPYRQILHQHPGLSLDSQGFFSQAEPESGDPAVETGSPAVETDSPPWGAGGATIDLERDLINTLKHEIKEILKYEEELNPEMTFEELGVKSLNAVEIIGALNTKLDLYLKTTLLFSYPTIEALGKYILAQYGQELRQKRSLRAKAAEAIKIEVEPKRAETPEALSTLLSEIETMSLAEMEALRVMLEGTNHG
jgi:acyl transferase domain-containing protein/SAM-dependent methyltransferase/acyl carrier protein